MIDSLDPPADFVIEVIPPMPALRPERLRLKQVFANLISNAINYHDRADGLIQVTTTDQGEFYELAVRDDGPSIAAQDHDTIFVICQTLQARDTVESTGIGLSLGKRLLKVKEAAFG